MHGIITSGNVQVGELLLWDSARLSIVSKIDIPAGEEEDLDLAVRCDDDSECYGFNNESYRYNWRNPHWHLPQGRYRVEVTLRSSGQKIAQHFLLCNDSSLGDFRLEDDQYSARVGESGYPPTILTTAERR